MKTFYQKKFLKDLLELPLATREIVEVFAFDQLPLINSIEEIKNLKKLKGHQSAYRVRLGDYRLGIIFENNTISLERIRHRSHFYRKFP